VFIRGVVVGARVAGQGGDDAGVVGVMVAQMVACLMGAPGTGSDSHIGHAAGTVSNQG
jgi:hypothetical protein